MKTHLRLLLLVLAAQWNLAAASTCGQTDDKGRCVLLEVSMVELIASPEKFDGSRVRVIGFLKLEFEGDALYLHKDDYTHSLLRNGLWADLDEKKLSKKATCRSGKYALVEAKFIAKNRGHMGLWSGALEEIARCEIWR